MKNAKHILKTALFCGVIALLPLVSVLGPRENTSFYENRTLAAFPAFSRASLLDGSFSPAQKTTSATISLSVFRCCG